MNGAITTKWWQKAVFYQVYLRSFADANDDGIGDFAGLTAKLDYLVDLGIGALWLSPHYPSPFLDCGYDISDFNGIAAEYGTLADFKTFLDQAHARGLRVVLDLVLNHSSDQHPWFKASRASKDSPKRDWYIWRDGRDGGPPNNWASIFGGSAWTLDEASGQYYYHAFLKEQPDLNWRNPDLKAAMWDSVRFWLDLGVDGFRLDALATIFEHPDLLDHSADLNAEDVLDANAFHKDAYQQLLVHQLKQPGLHPLMKELRSLVDTYPRDIVLIGEDEDVAFHGEADDELHLLFNFPLLQVKQFTPAHVRENQAERLAALPEGAWPCNTLGHHDVSRLRTRYGDGVNDEALAKVHLALLLTLKGTPFIYNGDEIGMTDLRLTDLGQIRDTAALNQFRLLTQRLGKSEEEALASVLAATRDVCRSPVQWQDAANAGFSPVGIDPWLPVNPNYREGVNIEAQRDDPTSIFSFCQRLISLRQSAPALLLGDYQLLEPDSKSCLVYLRHDTVSGQRLLVALNFSAAPQIVRLVLEVPSLELCFSNRNRMTDIDLKRLELAAFEILIAELN